MTNHSPQPEKKYGNALQLSGNLRHPKKDYVSMRVAGQMFGIAVMTVQDILKNPPITPVPLAAPEMYGLLNLRGRIVPTIDMKKRLDLIEGPPEQKRMCVVVEHQGESYGLMVDSVSEVLSLPEADCETSPANLAPKWHDASSGVYTLKDELMIVLDVAHLLAF